MKRPLFYSLPPAGNKIPIGTVARATKAKGTRSMMWLGPIERLLGTKHILYLSSGRASLWLILKALSKTRPDKEEVIIPAYTCPAVASAVLKAGLKPVLSDISLRHFGFALNDLATKINRHTLAIVVVHLFGYPADMERVIELGEQQNYFVIEDAAQAFGNTPLDSSDKKLGLLGDAGFYSFGRGKPISVMHGGLLVTNSEEIYREALKINNRLNHAANNHYLKYLLLLGSYSLFHNPHMYWIPQMIPFLHLGETIFESNFPTAEGLALAAWVLHELVQSLKTDQETRKTNSHWFATNLSDMPGAERPPHSAYPYLRYPLIVKEEKLRDRILEKLVSQGTGAALFYPCPLNELPRLKEILQDATIYPNARRLSETLITLPVHAGLTSSLRHKILTLIDRELRR